MKKETKNKNQQNVTQSYVMKTRQCVTNSSVEMSVSDLLEGKIRYLCEKFPSTEWSGIMFFKSVNEDNKISITAEDFYLLDVGTQSYTEYDISPDVFGYQIDHDLVDCWIGIIHSHNRMTTFFSGTDMNTLENSGMSMNHFLSLIVNNDGKYNARLTRIVDENISRNISASYKSFNNELFKYKYKQKSSERSLEWMPVNISVQPKRELTDEEKAFIDDRIKSIQSEKESRRVKYDERFSGFDDVFDFMKRDFGIVKKDETQESEYLAHALVYALVTGDIFMPNHIASMISKSGIKTIENIYAIKSKLIEKIIDKIDMNDYVDYMLCIYECCFGPLTRDVFECAIECMKECAEDNKWMNDIYEILLTYDL